MGKWTPAYSDSVVGMRFKALVSAAIDKHRVGFDGNPSTAPPLSYEEFAADIDEGDLFTQTLVDILVREYSERRARTSQVQGRLLIAECTANSLQELNENATVYGDYRPRTFPSHPSATDLFFASSPPRHDWDTVDNINDVMVDIGEDDAQTTATTGAVTTDGRATAHDEGSELGARLPTSLYDAFYPHRSVFDLSDDEEPSHSGETLSNRAIRRRRSLLASGSSTGLVRQPSIRRPQRSVSSRAIDFHDFTARRRSTGRSPPDPPSTSGTSTSDATSEGAGVANGWHDLTLRARALARQNRQQTFDNAFDGENLIDAALAHRPSYTHRRSTTVVGGSSTRLPSPLWQSAVATYSAPSLSLPSPASSSPRIPRLRRGGVPPPEIWSGIVASAQQELASGSQSVAERAVWRDISHQTPSQSPPAVVDPPEQSGSIAQWPSVNGDGGVGSADETTMADGDSSQSRSDDTQPVQNPPQLPTPRSVTPEEPVITSTEGSSSSL